MSKAKAVTAAATDHDAGDRRALDDAARLYRRGESRKGVFLDLVLHAVRGFDRPTVLDIGCGHGFDGDADVQRGIAEEAGRMIGVEPDPDVTPPECFAQVHRCLFEDAPIPAGSVQVAYAYSVLEHVADPRAFWSKLREVLAPGGAFLAVTPDSRHPFAAMSLWSGRLGVKDAYLDWLRGTRGTERYENYPTHYRCNRPRRIRRDARGLTLRHKPLHRVGQLDYYFPRAALPFVHVAERASMAVGLPGSLLLVLLRKP